MILEALKFFPKINYLLLNQIWFQLNNKKKFKNYDQNKVKKG
jgi:hypothetical protein